MMGDTMGFFGGGFMVNQGPFVETFRVNSMIMHDKEDKENGDKIILPMSAFEKLANMHISYPMQFELLNEAVMDLTGADAKEFRTHVGVLEFTAPEGKCFIPHWIMCKLSLEEGSFLRVKSVNLPLASFIKFRPQSEDFLEISNPKAVLESTLRNFSCVTKADSICIPYNDRKYYLDIVDVRPADACSIVEADVQVDFEAPPGYQEKLDAAKAAREAAEAAGNGTPSPIPTPAPAPTPGSVDGSVSSAGAGGADRASLTLAELAKAREARKKQLEDKNAGYVAYSGQGRRIDDKTRGTSANPTLSEALESVAAPVATARKGKWKSKTKGAAFSGTANKLQ